MKVRRLIAILEAKDLEAEVMVVTHEYAALEDSCGAYIDEEIAGVKIENGVVKIYCCFNANLEV